MVKTINSHGLGLAFNAENIPVCVVISTESVESHGQMLMTASHASVFGSNLHIQCGETLLALTNIDLAVQEAFGKRLPLLVMDRATGYEQLIPTERVY